MAHTEFEKTIKTTLGIYPQDINAAAFVSLVTSMSLAHHAAVFFNAGVLASDVICSIYQGSEDHPVVAVTSGGAEAGNFGIAGDLTALFTVGVLLVISGSTGNDGIYTVDAAESAYAGGVTTIEVDEAVASAVADGTLTLVKIIAGKTMTFTAATDLAISILEANASELDIANGFKSIIAHISAVGANAGFVGCTIHRFPLRYSPPAYVT